MFKKLIIAYCIAILLICTYVPWNAEMRQTNIHNKTARTHLVAAGYSFMWQPPQAQNQQATAVDLKRIGIEFIGATVIAGAIAFLIKNKGQ